jgi:glycosyltransferase involved in cell wall biosynthesis
VRLAVYTDDTYREDADGVSGEQSFVRFITSLGPLVERLVVLGRLDPDPGRSYYPLGADVEFGALPYYPSLTHPLKVLRSLAGSARSFWRTLDRVDTVWLLGPYIHAIGFTLLALIRRRRVVLGVRQDLPRYVRSRHPTLRWVHLAADGLEMTFRVLARRLPIVVVGPDLAARYGRAPQLLELMVSLVSAADLPTESEALARAERPVRRVLSVGRLDREKNPLLLVDAMAALHSTHPGIRLVLVGEGPMREEVQERVDKLGLGAVVEVRGYVPIDGELPSLYRSCDAFLHVSWTEGVPQVLFEAFAAALPVVATDVGGVARAVDDAALLIPPGDAAAAAEALRRLADERQLRERLIREGLRQVGERTLEATTNRLVTFLERSRASS